MSCTSKIKHFYYSQTKNKIQRISQGYNQFFSLHLHELKYFQGFSIKHLLDIDIQNTFNLRYIKHLNKCKYTYFLETKKLYNFSVSNTFFK